MESPHYVVPGLRAFNEKEAGVGSVTDQKNQLLEEGGVISGWLWCPGLAVDLLRVWGWGFTVCFFPAPGMEG